MWLRLLPHHHIAKLPDHLYRYASMPSNRAARAARSARRVISAKLDYLRRRARGCRARAVVIMDTTRAQAYSEIGPRFDFNLYPPPGRTPRTSRTRTLQPRTSEPQNPEHSTFRALEPFSVCDLFVVTDFASVLATRPPGTGDRVGLVDREGNLFRARRGGT